LSLSLLLDEDSQAKLLVKFLTASGHDVLTVNEVGISGFPDEQVLDYARQHNRVIVTRNCSDFRELHQANPLHLGILAVYQETDTSKSMSYQAIVNAVDNLVAVNLDLTGQFIVLNQWNY
jgi:predicted nuclease of predicted toxin-antitoxin system